MIIIICRVLIHTQMMSLSIIIAVSQSLEKLLIIYTALNAHSTKQLTSGDLQEPSLYMDFDCVRS